MALNRLQQIPDIPFWLLSIGAGLIAIHLTLTLQTDQSEIFSASILYWLAVGSLVWQNRHRFSYRSSAIATLVGLLLIAFVLFRSQLLSGADLFLRIAPLLSAVGLGLLASGFWGLKQYWQEFVILSCLVPHGALLSQLYDISEVTARVSTSLLWYTGFSVERQGVYIVLPTGSVEVNPGCSGYGVMLQLLGLSITYLFMFPTNRLQKVIVPIVGVLIGFGMNTIRVAILAVLSAESNRAAFDYWHKGDGSLLFSLASVLLFGGFCYLLMQAPSAEQPSEP